MAPPANRRPTYSRRAQYGTFIRYVVAFAGLFAGVLLLIVSLGDGASFAGMRGAASDVVAPAGQVSAKSRAETRGLLATIGGFFTYGSRVARMEQELDAARVALAEAEALRRENAQLKDLVKLSQVDPRALVVTRLIGSSGSSTRRFATLGAGAQQGVRPGMPVRSPAGLVGRVLETAQSSARVLLITDSESIVPVRRARDGVAATAIGKGDGTIQLKLIAQGINPLKPGDAIVTSGSGGLFWPDTAFAVVASLTPDGAIARPLSDPGSTNYVEVQPVWIETAIPGAIPAEPAPSGGK